MAKFPKLTMSQDGLARITLKMEHRLSLHDLAIFFMSRHEGIEDYLDDNAAIAQKFVALVETKTATEIMADIRSEVSGLGVESPHYRVGDRYGGNDTDMVEQVKHAIAQKLGYEKGE